jgi:nondiscriminating aspartyl-tRNA synthetase
MKRTNIKELKHHVGKKVMLMGHIAQLRQLKNMSFIILREKNGYCQIILPSSIIKEQLTVESTIKVTGIVKEEEQSKYNKIEVVAESIEILSTAEILPFPINREEGLPPFNTLNIFRPITLRREKERCIFKIQSEIIWAYREYLRSQGFVEIQSTKISAAGLEGGSELFEVNYFGEKLFLTQSPQFYKQMMVGVYERVFEVGKVYRAEGSSTNKHLSEFIGFEFEMGFIESVEEIMKMEENVFQHIFTHLNLNCIEELQFLGITKLEFKPIPRLTYNECIEILNSEFNLNYKEIGLTTEAERLISQYIFKNTESEFVFITKYPLSERPFYAMPSIEIGMSETFELLYKGMEITSGGQRIHNYKQLVESINKKGLNPENFESYLMSFKYGMPPHGGMGIGLERVIKQMLNLNSVEEASLIPRTKEKNIH